MSDGAGVQWEASAQLARGTDRGGVQSEVQTRDGRVTDNSPCPSSSQSGGLISEFIHICERRDFKTVGAESHVIKMSELHLKKRKKKKWGDLWVQEEIRLLFIVTASLFNPHPFTGTAHFHSPTSTYINCRAAA